MFGRRDGGPSHGALGGAGGYSRLGATRSRTITRSRSRPGASSRTRTRTCAGVCASTDPSCRASSQLRTGKAPKGTVHDESAGTNNSREKHNQKPLAHELRRKVHLNGKRGGFVGSGGPRLRPRDFQLAGSRARSGAPQDLLLVLRSWRKVSFSCPHAQSAQSCEAVSSLPSPNRRLQLHEPRPIASIFLAFIFPRSFAPTLFNMTQFCVF